MTVWIVERGEEQEGGYVLSVHATYDGAATEAERAAVNPPHYSRQWERVGNDRWECGCNYITVTEYGVVG